MNFSYIENSKTWNKKRRISQIPSSQFWDEGKIQHLQQVKKQENNPVIQNINFQLNPLNKIIYINQKVTIFYIDSNFKYKKKRKKRERKKKLGYEHLSGVVESIFEKRGDLILRNFHCSSFWNQLSLSNSKGFNLIGCK